MNRLLQDREGKQVVSRLTVVSSGVRDLCQNYMKAPQPTNRRNRHFAEALSPKGQKPKSISIKILPLVRSLERPKLKIPLHLNSSVLNVTISNCSKNRVQQNRQEIITSQNLKTSSGESFENRSPDIYQDKEVLLQQILFGTSQCGTLVIQDSQFQRSEIEHVQDGCGCGCRVQFSKTNVEFCGNPIKKRINKFTTELIVQHLLRNFHNIQRITSNQAKDAFTRWLMFNKIVFRYEHLNSLISQLFPTPNPICFRKLCQFFSTFTQSNDNNLNMAWSKLNRTFISVAQIKVLILNNSPNKFYDQIRQVFRSLGLKDDEDICYWDMFVIREKAKELIGMLEEALKVQANSEASVDVSLSASRSMSSSLQLI